MTVLRMGAATVLCTLNVDRLLFCFDTPGQLTGSVAQLLMAHNGARATHQRHIRHHKRQPEAAVAAAVDVVREPGEAINQSVQGASLRGWVCGKAGNVGCNRAVACAVACFASQTRIPACNCIRLRLAQSRSDRPLP